VTKESYRGGRAHDRSSGKGVAGVGRRRRARSWHSSDAVTRRRAIALTRQSRGDGGCRTAPLARYRLAPRRREITFGRRSATPPRHCADRKSNHQRDVVAPRRALLPSSRCPHTSDLKGASVRGRARANRQSGGNARLPVLVHLETLRRDDRRARVPAGPAPIAFAGDQRGGGPSKQGMWVDALAPLQSN
jgi:hypothetical protein